MQLCRDTAGSAFKVVSHVLWGPSLAGMGVPFAKFLVSVVDNSFWLSYTASCQGNKPTGDKKMMSKDGEVLESGNVDGSTSSGPNADVGFHDLAGC